MPWALVAVLTLLLTLVLWRPWRQPIPPSRPVTRFTIDLPSAESLESWSDIALAPDGTRIVYVAFHNGISQLYLRELEQFDARPIAEKAGALDPFFSPDGEWVAFFTSRELKKVSLRSGALVTLCNASSVSSGGYWESDGTIYFTMTPESGLVRTSAGGGTPQAVTTPDSAQGELGHHHPEVLPGGMVLLFTAFGSAEWLYQHRLAVLSLESGAWHAVTEYKTTLYVNGPSCLFSGGGVSCCSLRS